MKQWTILTAVAALTSAATLTSTAQTTTLSEALFNEDGTVYDQHPNSTSPISAPGVSVTSGFGNGGYPTTGPQYLSGFGTLEYTITGAGAHDFIGFLDEEANVQQGFTHDTGTVVNAGSAPSYLSWQVGNPSSTGPGSIGYNAAHSAPGSDLLDDANDIAGETTDVAIALGFDFTLLAGQTATIDITASSTAPSSGFYLDQEWNSDSYNLPPSDPYYTETLVISSNTVGTAPDNGATWFTLLLGLTSLAGAMRFERKCFQRKG